MRPGERRRWTHERSNVQRSYHRGEFTPRVSGGEKQEFGDPLLWERADFRGLRRNLFFERKDGVSKKPGHR